MRVNSYNKFFAEAAKIMNTEVKSVKQLDGRYKVELANHVYLNVYRGVSGSLFIHDHRGVSHITSCYDFDDFKTMKDLYERLITDYSESTNAETVTQTSEETKADEEAEETKATEEIPNAKKCTIAYCCIADRKYNRCGGTQTCRTTWERYRAIVNPEWHHVSLATLANIDFDMLDEKRKVYLSFLQKWREVRKNLSKCSCGSSYERCYNVFIGSLITALAEKKISKALVEYFDRQVSMVNVECGVWSSAVEVATGEHYSRKYNSQTLRY